jgi:OmpA-OmpF porin, OOP family
MLSAFVSLFLAGIASAATPLPALDGNRLVLPSAVDFGAGTATLAPGADPALQAILAWLNAKPEITLMRIEGHAEDQDLSGKRAMAVTTWLVAHGVACSRLIPVGFGAMKPVADSSTAEGKARNTRIEAIDAELNGRPIGGMPIDGGGLLAGDPCP